MAKTESIDEYLEYYTDFVCDYDAWLMVQIERTRMLNIPDVQKHELIHRINQVNCDLRTMIQYNISILKGTGLLQPIIDCIKLWRFSKPFNKHVLELDKTWEKYTGETYKPFSRKYHTLYEQMLERRCQDGISEESA